MTNCTNKSIDEKELIITTHQDGIVSEQTLHYYQYTDHSFKENNTPCLLFLHGILGDARTWEPYLNQFPGYNAIALTQSGFGKAASENDELFDTQRHATELLAFCQKLREIHGNDTLKFYVVAWSYACHPTLLAAIENSELFAGLFFYELIVPSYGMNQGEHALFSQDITEMMSPIMRATRRKKTAEAIDLFITACKNEPFTLSQQEKAIQIIKLDNQHSLAKLLTQTTPRDISVAELEILAEKLPISVHWGEKSRLIFSLSSQAFLRAISKDSLTNTSHNGIIKECDHLLPENNPERLIEIIREKLHQIK